MAGYVMTVDQALDAARAGGFSYNNGLITIVCIGWAESRWRTDARNTNSNGTIDRGWLQINSIHTDISDADCDNPAKAAAYAYKNLSKLGTSFSPWVAFTSGAYKGPDNIVWTAVQKAYSASVLQDQVNTLQTQNNALANQVSSLQTQLGAANDTISTLQAQVNAANSTISTLQAQVSALNGQVATLNTKLSQAQSDLSACQSTSAAKDSQISSLQSKIDRAKSDLA
jgi:hypothetical protein